MQTPESDDLFSDGLSYLVGQVAKSLTILDSFWTRAGQINNKLCLYSRRPWAEDQNPVSQKDGFTNIMSHHNSR